jgi:hypothetical protein
MLGRDTFKTLLAASALALMAGGASAATVFNVTNVTGNSAVNADAGEGQLFVDVLEILGGVSFVFRNEGPASMVISEIYFDFGSTAYLTGGALGAASPGVVFQVGGSPPNLPGGETIGFTADALFTATSPPSKDGVGVPEFQTIVFSLTSGSNYGDVVTAMLSNSFRAGFHVISFENGGSESFVTSPTPVPVPAAGFLLIGALGGLAAVRRRRRAI